MSNNTMKRIIRLCLSLMLICLASHPALAEKQAPWFTYEQIIERYNVGANLLNENITEKRIRIESMLGVKYFSEKEITYSKTYKEVEILDAYTLQPDGTRIPVPANSIHDRLKKTEANNLTDRVTKVIVFPEVKVGSRLYWKVRTRTHTQAYPGHVFMIDLLPLSVKTEHAEYHLTHDAGTPIRVVAKGLEGGILPDQGDGRLRYRFTGANLNPVNLEDDQVAHGDVAPMFSASTFENWGALGQAFYSRARLPEILPPAIDALAEELTRGRDTAHAQAQAIHQWITQNIRYLALNFNDGGLVPRPLESILATRYGDCKDQALLFQAMLKARGIDSEPVLINQGKNYRLPELAVNYPLNHVITYIPSLDVYVDTTSPFVPFGELSKGLMGKPAVLAQSGMLAKTPFTSGQHNRSETMTHMKMLEDGQIVGEGKASVTGWVGTAYRSTADATPDRMVRERLESYHLSGTGHITHSDPRDLSVPYTETFEFTLDPLTNIPGRGAFTIPAGLAPYSMHDLATNVHPDELEGIPMVCVSHGIVEDYSIRLPRSIRVRHIPKAVTYRDGVIDYRSSYRLKGGTLHVKRMIEVNRPGPVCGKQEHEQWVKFLAVLRKDLRSQVVYE